MSARRKATPPSTTLGMAGSFSGGLPGERAQMKRDSFLHRSKFGTGVHIGRVIQNALIINQSDISFC